MSRFRHPADPDLDIEGVTYLETDDNGPALWGRMRSFVTWCERRGLSARTIRLYTQRIADFEDWLADHSRGPARRATWRDVRRYAETKKNSHATRNGFRSALVAFYRSCGRRDGGPAWAVPVPKRKRGSYRGFTTREEWEKLIAAARTFGPLQHAACAAMYYQGLRREECATLRWEDMKNGTLTIVGKGDFEDELPLHPKFAAALQELVPESPWVFPGRWPGTHSSVATVWMWVRLAGERAGVGHVTPHRIRHTAIATVNKAKGLRTASVFARHRRIETTMIYTFTEQAELIEGMGAL